MKRFGFLFEKVYDIENLKLAHKNARKKKLHYKEVQKIDKDPDKYLNELHLLLKEKKFKNSKYEIFTKKTDNGKIREIYKLPYFPDRIIHHAIIQVVGRIWKSTLIRDTLSSIKGRGIHDGVRRLSKALEDKENTKYCLKMDVSKYYPSIDNKILKQFLRKKIKDFNFLWLLDEIISSVIGIPIGNYLSQYFGNLYLSELDHKLKNKCKYYFRYCDDMVIIHKCKIVLHKIKKFIDEYLTKFRNLKLKANWQVFPVAVRGIDFLGYRSFHKYKLLRKTIKLRFVKLINHIKKNNTTMSHYAIINGIMSYNGWFKYGNCLNLKRKYVSKDIIELIDKISFKHKLNNPIYKMTA